MSIACWILLKLKILLILSWQEYINNGEKRFNQSVFLFIFWGTAHVLTAFCISEKYCCNVALQLTGICRAPFMYFWSMAPAASPALPTSIRVAAVAPLPIRRCIWSNLFGHSLHRFKKVVSTTIPVRIGA